MQSIKCYFPLSNLSIPEFLEDVPEVDRLLGSDRSKWTAREVGDGNLNAVYIVAGEGGSLIVKQALPYLRLVGEAWPLPLERSYFEYLALTEETAHAGHLVPRIHHFDKAMAAIVMEYLEAIGNRGVRAVCELNALALARTLVLDASSFGHISLVTAAARAIH